MFPTIVGALMIGITLGLLGSGGSTITVPILVYLVGHDAKVSIAESMAIVGLISAAGAVPFARSGSVNWRSVILFGIPAMLGTFLGAFLGGLAADSLQLIVFGIVLILSSGLMVRKAFSRSQQAVQSPAESRIHPEGMRRNAMILTEGVVVGTLTGFVGVGGGFLIVPALLLLGKLPMRTAIGTSLVIIVMKSVIGFAKYQHYLLGHGMTVDWNIILIFSVIGLAGSFLGQSVNKRLDQRTLIQVFSVFLIMVGGYVIFNEGARLFRDAPAKKEKTVQAALMQAVDWTVGSNGQTGEFAGDTFASL